MADETPLEQGPEQPDADAALDQQLKDFYNERGQGKSEWVADERPDIDSEAFNGLTHVAEGYQAFTAAMASGDFQTAEQMLEQWSPAVLEGFKEYIYAKEVESGAWIDRFIQDRTGGRNNSRLDGLQKQNEHLRSMIMQRHNAEVGAAQDQIVRDYVNHIETLARQTGLKGEHLNTIHNEVNAAVSRDPKLRAAINSGNTRAVNSAFKAAVQKIQLGPEAPENINDVKPVGDETKADALDRWMTQQLHKVKGRK